MAGKKQWYEIAILTITARICLGSPPRRRPLPEWASSDVRVELFNTHDFQETMDVHADPVCFQFVRQASNSNEGSEAITPNKVFFPSGVV